MSLHFNSNVIRCALRIRRCWMCVERREKWIEWLIMQSRASCSAALGEAKVCRFPDRWRGQEKGFWAWSRLKCQVVVIGRPSAWDDDGSRFSVMDLGALGVWEKLSANLCLLHYNVNVLTTQKAEPFVNCHRCSAVDSLRSRIVSASFSASGERGDEATKPHF